MKDFLRLKLDAVVVKSKIYDKHGNNPLVGIEVKRRRKESKYWDSSKGIKAKLDFHYTLREEKILWNALES